MFALSSVALIEQLFEMMNGFQFNKRALKSGCEKLSFELIQEMI
jgi:hypothetical protein